MRKSNSSGKSLKPVRSSHAGRKNLTTYLFLSPTIVGLILFVVVPFAYSLVISFTSWSILSPPVFVGMKNFIKVFTNDKVAMNSFLVTLYFVGVSLPINLLVALMLALLLNVEIRGQGVYRLLYYLPAMIMGAPLTILWRWIYAKEGLVNLILGLVGIEGPAWRYDRVWVMPAVIIMSLWTVGAMVLIFLGGLKAIPKGVYESAQIDGAGRIRRYFSITLPLLSPIILYNMFLGIIGAVQSFDAIYILTGGGPMRRTEIWVLYIYRMAFVSRKMGYASALSWVLFIGIFLLTLVMFRVTKRWVFYAGGEDEK